MNMVAPSLSIPAPAPLAVPVTHDVTIVTTKKLAQARVLVCHRKIRDRACRAHLAGLQLLLHEIVTKTKAN